MQVVVFFGHSSALLLLTYVDFGTFCTLRLFTLMTTYIALDQKENIQFAESGGRNT